MIPNQKTNERESLRRQSRRLSSAQCASAVKEDLTAKSAMVYAKDAKFRHCADIVGAVRLCGKRRLNRKERKGFTQRTQSSVIAATKSATLVGDSRLCYIVYCNVKIENC